MICINSNIKRKLYLESRNCNIFIADDFALNGIVTYLLSVVKSSNIITGTVLYVPMVSDVYPRMNVLPAVNTGVPVFSYSADATKYLVGCSYSNSSPKMRYFHSSVNPCSRFLPVSSCCIAPCLIRCFLAIFLSSAAINVSTSLNASAIICCSLIFGHRMFTFLTSSLYKAPSDVVAFISLNCLFPKSDFRK